METKTKKSLVQQISRKLEMHPNEVKKVVQGFLDEMINTLSQGNRLEFRDFGVFEVVVRKKKIGRNPKKPLNPVVIPERKAVKFRAGKKMKKVVEAL